MELIKQENAIIYNTKQIELIKQTVAKGATDAELTMFIEFCKGTGLNPFKKEIWFIKTNAGVHIMTGINGFYQIANSNPLYDGIEVDTELDKNGKPIQSVAKAWRKDRRIPSTGVARWSEFGKTFGNWKNMPILMLEKCAESLALRKAFPQELNGLYTAEEMPAGYNKSDTFTPAEEKAMADIEEKQRRNHLKHQAVKLQADEEYILEHGSKKGQPLSKIDNGIHLKKHLEKYRELIPAQGIKQIEERLQYLREQYLEAKRQEKQQEFLAGTYKTATKQNELAEHYEGWTPGPDEEAEILKQEKLEAEKDRKLSAVIQPEEIKMFIRESEEEY